MRTQIATLVASSDWKQTWLDTYPCDQPSVVPYPRVPLYALLHRAAQRHPQHPACTIYGKPMSFSEMDDQSRRLANSLIKLGVGPGRHVGLMMPNIPEYLVSLQAVWLTGATALQLSPLMVAEEIGHWLEATNCDVVITLDLLAPAVMASLDRGLVKHLILTTLARRMAMWQGLIYRMVSLRRNGYMYAPDDARRHAFESMLRAEPLANPAAVNPEEDVAVLAPTGGTTASPKAVMLTHRNLVANAMQLRHRCGGADTQDSVLAVLPFFHSYGLSVSLLSAWAGCNTMHLYPRFEARAVLSLIETQRPTLIPAVPAMLAALNKVMRGRTPDLSFVRAVISGASALAADVREDFEKTRIGELVEGYGLTEASPVTHVNPEKEANRPGTIGVPLADTECRLINPDTGEDVAVGEVGEILIRGPQVMKGYFNNPLATDEVLRDGWLHTGDMAMRDSDGYYAIVDRKRDIIKTSGFLVYPAEVEEVLRSHPDVSEAAVIGVLDHDRGEVVKAMVVPHTGRTVTVAALEEHCKLHLSKHKRPRQYEMVKELPRNFLGKVLRRKLREPANS